ncbi:MAG: S-layer homology domain-containing protein [Oscillospiraceae bacterium]|nr:S-layer homology domain-containing protein [Oscillospiraceae bacterium]
MNKKYINIKRGIIAAVLAMQSIAAVSPVTADSIEAAGLKQFTDYAVDQGYGKLQGHWAEQDIGVLYGRGGINGIPNEDGSVRFDANATITTAQFLALILQASGNNNLDSAYDWAGGVLKKSSDLGIIGGAYISYDNNRNKPITREYAAFILDRANDHIMKEPVVFPNQIDVASKVLNDIGTATTNDTTFIGTTRDVVNMQDYIGYVLAAGIMEGDNNGNFNPQSPMTRAEATAVINRLFKYTPRIDTTNLKNNYGLEVWESGVSPEIEARNNSPEVQAGREAARNKWTNR